MSARPEGADAAAVRWLELARDDLLSARTILAYQDRAFRVAGFHAQQAAEKALKSLYVVSNREVPRIHDLVALHAALRKRVQGVDDAKLDELTPWAIVGRYAADLPEADHALATTLVEIAEGVLEAVTERLSEFIADDETDDEGA